MISEIPDIALELEPGWLTHLPSQAAIGGLDPLSSGLIQSPPGAPGKLLLFDQGPAYSTIEGYLIRPFFDFPFLRLEFSLTVDGNTGTQGQVIETDVIAISAAGDLYDSSARLAIFKGWMFQVDGPSAIGTSAKWMDTGIKIAPLTPDVPHAIAILHGYDLVAKTSSVLSLSVDGVVSRIPAAFQKIPAVPSTWLKSTATIQFQQTVPAGAGGGYSIELSGVNLRHFAKVPQ